MYGTGSPVEEIQRQFGCSRSSLLSWCRTYRFKGLSGLEDQRQGGNNARLTDGQIADLTRRLQTYTPRSVFGQKTSTQDGLQWTVEDLYKAIKLWYGVIYHSRSSYYKLLDMCAPNNEQIHPKT
jgi:transposase